MPVSKTTPPTRLEENTRSDRSLHSHLTASPEDKIRQAGAPTKDIPKTVPLEGSCAPSEHNAASPSEDASNLASPNHTQEHRDKKKR